MPKIFLFAAILLSGGLLYLFFNLPTWEDAAEFESNDNTPALIADPQVHQGMKQVMASGPFTLTPVTSESDYPAIPDSIVEESDERDTIPEGMDPELARGHKDIQAINRDSIRTQYHQELEELEATLPDDLVRLRELEAQGNQEQASVLRQVIQSRQARLSELQNNPPEEVTNE